MTPEKFKRKLSAILSADVKGYSRLMGEDEEGTIRTLNAYLEMITNSVQKHRGRVVNTAGDSLLAEFVSVVDAVRSAVEIQEELKERNKELSEDRRMEFRIGINLGDVVEEGENILGDGVNVAARVQSLAEPGGISISGTAYDHVKKKLVLGYEYLGEQAVKNISEPVRIYRVRMEAEVASAKLVEERKPVGRRVSKSAYIVAASILVVAALVLWQFVLRPSSSKIEFASKDKMAFPLPEKPSIAVLPFTNLSDDPKQDYLADGLVEEIISGLSKCSEIFVIARNSTFIYKGKPIKPQRVAEEMGVQYVLEGSLRKTGDKVRISAQLIDALTGRHLFSERYDRELKDLLQLQDEITMKVLNAIEVKLVAGEDVRIRTKRAKNLEIYLKLMQARKHLQTWNKESQALARQLYEEVSAMDPNFAGVYSALGTVTYNEVMLGVHKDPRKALEKAVELGKKAVALGDSSSLAHSQLVYPYIILREHDKAIAEAERAVALEPNSAVAYNALAWAIHCDGRSQEAIPFFKKSIRLSPIPLPGALVNMGHAYRQTGQYEEAVAAYKRAIQIYGADHLPGHLGLAGAYALMGREKEARAEAAEVLRIDPKFSLERIARLMPFKSQAMIDNVIEPLRKAGLK